jgi:hypothetical protein
VIEKDFDYLSREFIMKYSAQYIVHEKGEKDKYLRYTISSSTLALPLFMTIPAKKKWIDSEAVDNLLVSLEAGPSSIH